MSETSVTIVGNITRNPEIKTTNGGKLVTRLRVASTRKRYIEGQWIDGETAYIDVDCWEHLAQNAVNTFSKGDRIIAEGRLRTDQWEDNGVKKTFTKIVADSVGPDLRFATAAITRPFRDGRVYGVVEHAVSFHEESPASSAGLSGSGSGGVSAASTLTTSTRIISSVIAVSSSPGSGAVSGSASRRASAAAYSAAHPGVAMNVTRRSSAQASGLSTVLTVATHAPMRPIRAASFAMRD